MSVFSHVPSNGSYAIPSFSLRQHVFYFYRNVHLLFTDTFFIHWSEFASNYHVYLLESWVTLVLAGILSIYLVFSKVYVIYPQKKSRNIKIIESVSWDLHVGFPHLCLVISLSLLTLGFRKERLCISQTGRANRLCFCCFKFNRNIHR